MDFPPIIPYDGVTGMTDVLIAAIANGGMTSRVHLFGNLYTPAALTTVANFVECTAGGMGAQVLGVPTSRPIDASGRAAWIWPPNVFTASGAGLPTVVYGFWVDFVDPIGGATRVLWCQRFQSPIALLAAGNQVTFQLSMGGKQC